MDAANIDLKGFSERFYKDLCSGKLAAVLETLDYLKHETKVWRCSFPAKMIHEGKSKRRVPG